MTGRATARHIAFWGFVVAAAVVVVVSTVQTFTADPHEGEGWIGGPIQLVLAGGPLVVVALGLRSERRSVARRTAVAALVLALAVGFVLVAQLLDANETAGDRLVQALVLVLYLTAVAVEWPAFTGRRPTGRPPPA